jgi:hypothetical protein
MPMVITPESELGREMAKWNKPYRYEPFPVLLYKARRREDGIVIAEGPGCWLKANSEQERDKLKTQGWCDSPHDALDRFEKLEQEIAEAAANRAYQDSKMSEKAQAEAAAAETDGPEHLAEIKEQPRQKRKYTRRAKPAV